MPNPTSPRVVEKGKTCHFCGKPEKNIGNRPHCPSKATLQEENQHTKVTRRRGTIKPNASYSPVAQSVEQRTVNPLVAGSSPAGGAFAKVLTLATKRLNARRREIDRRAFLVTTQFLAGFRHLSRCAGPNGHALCLQRDFRLSNATFKVASVGAKNRPELSDSLFSRASRINTEFSLGVRLRTGSNFRIWVAGTAKP